MIIEEQMGQPDPINDILREVRGEIEKRLITTYIDNDKEATLRYLFNYRLCTKLLNREPLSIFDF